MVKFLFLLLFPSISFAGTCTISDVARTKTQVRYKVDFVSLSKCMNDWWNLKPVLMDIQYKVPGDVFDQSVISDRIRFEYSEEDHNHLMTSGGIRKMNEELND